MGLVSILPNIIVQTKIPQPGRDLLRCGSGLSALQLCLETNQDLQPQRGLDYLQHASGGAQEWPCLANSARAGTAAQSGTLKCPFSLDKGA